MVSVAVFLGVFAAAFFFFRAAVPLNRGFCRISEPKAV